MKNKIDFSIVTPSFKMLQYLKLCHASIADQANVSVDHIIIDGGSMDGTKEWMKENNIKGVSEKDKGMYDAINKGFAMASGDFVAYLNCDEQYLVGTLEKVKNYFLNHPEVDVVFGDALIVDPTGNLLSYRKSYKPFSELIKTSHLHILSCTLFFKRSIIDEGMRFDTGLRDLGDRDFILRLLERKHKFGHINQYLSVFTWTGNNMSTSENATREKKLFAGRIPLWMKMLRLPINIFRISLKTLSGAYRTSMPVRYEIYTFDSMYHRVSFEDKHPSFKWPSNILANK
jgi:glycosyltransferase involved in cell wall biosynthesis